LVSLSGVAVAVGSAVAVGAAVGLGGGVSVANSTRLVTPPPADGVAVGVVVFPASGMATLTPGGNGPRTARSVGDGVTVAPPNGVNVGRGVLVGVGLPAAGRPTRAWPTEQLRLAAARSNAANASNPNRDDADLLFGRLLFFARKHHIVPL
jgi:hypothetical protein